MDKKVEGAMSDPIRARLAKFLEHESLNNKTFEERCGLYNGFVRALDTKITFESLAKIGTACPNLNLGWLFSGVGEMLVSSGSQASVNIENVQSVFITNVDDIATAVARVLNRR